MKHRKFVIYNGVQMTADWPEKIEQSQRLEYYTCQGRKYPRIRFGEDDPRWGDRPCRDCGVLRGQYHVVNCEYELCPACRQPFAGRCNCEIAELKTAPEKETVRRTDSRGFRLFMYGLLVVAGLLLLRAILMLFGI